MTAYLEPLKKKSLAPKWKQHREVPEKYPEVKYMQSLEDLGMQTWETAKKGIYFEEFFSPVYDSLFHVCAFIIREDSLAERQGEEKSRWVQMIKSKVGFGGASS